MKSMLVLQHFVLLQLQQYYREWQGETRQTPNLTWQQKTNSKRTMNSTGIGNAESGLNCLTLSQTALSQNGYGDLRLISVWRGAGNA